MDCKRPDLDRVWWLGGSACAGKTNIAERLAQRPGDLTIYACDDHFPAHRQRADRRRYPGFCRIMDLSGEELWMRPVERQVSELRRFYEDEIEMVVEDLADLTPPGPILVEGSGLLPATIAGLVRSPRQALWLVATPEFRRRHYPQRGPWVRQLLADCRDPERAYDRWMARDDLYATWIVEQAEHVGGRALTVDGSQTLEQTADRVAELLGLDAPSEPISLNHPAS